MQDFEKFILQYEKLIYNLAYRMMGNKQDAEDIFQESILKIYKNMNKCKEKENISSWICTVVHNTCIDELRRKKRRYTESIDSKLDFDDGSMMNKQLADNTKTPEEQLVNSELAEDIQKALNRLPADQKSLIVLRDIQGMSYEEISKNLKIPIGTVKSRINRGRERLKEYLMPLYS